MLYICYDSGYKEVTAADFPGLSNIIQNKCLEFHEDEPRGHLMNRVNTSKKFQGADLILTEMFLTNFNYTTAVHEINAGDSPVLYYKPLNCFIRLVREFKPKTEA